MMSLRRTFALILALAAALLLTACDLTDATPTPVAPPSPTVVSNGEITVFAASSLTDVFNEIAKGATSNVDITGGEIKKVTYNFAGSQALVTQLSQGAKADLLVTADEKTMRSAVDAGIILTNTYRTFASNKLAVITAPGSNSKISTLQDLAKPGLKLVLAADAVPAGNYSLQILNKLSADPAYGADFKDKVMANVVSREDNVRQVATKVQLGEADAGIVYQTDAKAANLPTIDIPDQYNVVAEYFLSVLPNAPNEDPTRLFVGYLFSDAGQKTLRDFGFGPPIPR
jgi:molybdate transport system substrate-binding protein